MDNVQQVKTLLDSLANETEALDGVLNDTVLEKNLNELLVDLDGDDTESQLAKCKLLNSYSYVIASLYFSYLKSSGLNKQNDHPVMQELSRVKSCIGRVSKAEKTDEEEERREKKRAEEAEQFIQKEFGVKKYDPAVSGVTFEGKHKRFDKGETAQDSGKLKRQHSKHAQTKRKNRRTKK